MKFEPTMVNAFVPGNAVLSAREEAIIARRAQLLGPAYRLLYARPVEVVRGEDVWLYDAGGNKLLDAYNNVCSVGHSHPHVVAALTRQASILATNTRYMNEPVLDFAERLLKTFEPELAHVMFTCTGSESNDLAVRLARARTGGTGFIVTECAYHGTSHMAASMSPSLGVQNPLGEHVRTVPAPESYRAGDEDVGVAFRKSVEAAIASLQKAGIKPAALIVDTIFSSDGVLSDPPGFLSGAVSAIREAGGLFIADEVQPGFARTGKHMWGYQRHAIVPDIVTLGKPMGNGYPVAALVTRPDILAEFGRNTRYFNTFGGNTVAVAVAGAVLDVIESENLMQNANAVGAYLKCSLKELAADVPEIGDVRGAGLFIGIEIVSNRDTKEPDPRLAADLVNGLREDGVLISGCGLRANTLKIRPPLTFRKEHADLLVGALTKALQSYTNRH